MATKEQEQGKQKKARLRSPGYPAIDLETAIARARELYEKERMNTAAVSVILSHWGYTGKTGAALVVLAALIKFGLLADEGAGDKRKARLTDLARRIILDDRLNSPERDAAIREAALNPTIHKELWNQYKGELPSDDNLRYELRANRGFTDYGVSEFIEEFRRTVAFTKLTKSATMSEEDKDKPPTESEGKMFQHPQTPTLEKDNKSQADKPSSVKYSWPLAKNVTAEVTITGPAIFPKDLEMLRKYLELAKDALQDQQ